jgi:hypothetical protein
MDGQDMHLLLFHAFKSPPEAVCTIRTKEIFI